METRYEVRYPDGSYETYEEAGDAFEIAEIENLSFAAAQVYAVTAVGDIRLG
jgi:hypothetical protein